MPAAAASACDDGIDTDGDGPADGDDSGCSPPYRLDDVEGNVWDTDASAVFDDGGVRNSPSLLIPGATKNPDSGLGNSLNNPPKNDNNGKERVVQDPGNDGDDYGNDDDQEDYGSGTLSSKQPAVPGDWEKRKTGFLGLTGAQEYVDPPRNGDCGDARDNGESPLRCPTDVGMVDDIGTGGASSDRSVSEIEGKYEVGTSQANDAIHIDEPEGTKSCDMDAGDCPSINSNPLVRYEGGPNHYISGSDKLMRISKPGINTNTIGTTTDYDLDYTRYNVIDSDGSATSETCDASGNYSCNLVSSTRPTTSVSSTSHDLYELEDDTDVHTRTTSDFLLTSDGKGYDLNEDTAQLEITVEHDNYDDTGNDFIEENPGGSTTITKYSCQLNGIDGPGSSCTITDDFTTDTYTFTTSSPQPTDYTSDQETFQHEEVPSSGWPKDTVVNVNDGSAKGVVAEDYGTVHHKKEGGTGYFSVDPGDDNVEFGNDRAFGWSTFDLTMDGDEFAAERTGSEVYRAGDGDNGERDTLVAVHETAEFPNSGFIDSTDDDWWIGEGIVGSSGDFGRYLSESDISVECPQRYTKCVAAIDVHLDSFDNWDSHDNPGTGADYDVVAKAGLGESLSACKMYQRLNEDGEEVQCTYKQGSSPLPYGPPSDSTPPGQEFVHELHSATFDGPAADKSRNDANPAFAEHQVKSDNCVFNGSSYPEFALKDIGEEVNLKDGKAHLETGDYSLDQEVCIDRDDGSPNGDLTGDWYDVDSSIVNSYLSRFPASRSVSKPGATGDSILPLNTYHDDVVNVDGAFRAGSSLVYGGAALEDNCHPSLECGDNGPPYYVPFREGAVTADYNPFISGGDVDGDGTPETQIDLERWYNKHPITDTLSGIQGTVEDPTSPDSVPPGVNLPPGMSSLPEDIKTATTAEGMHNTVNISTGSEHGDGTVPRQGEETSLDLKALNNSQIDLVDDEWGLSPNLSYVINNSGHSLKPSTCHGKSREQGRDLNKYNRSYANSYANYTPRGGEWVNPDNTVRSVKRGGLDCDLTGKDWGIAYDPLSTGDGGPDSNLPEEGGTIPAITFVGEGRLIPPSNEGFGRRDSGGVEAICIGGGCEERAGTPTSEDEDDDVVDDTGDTMNGTLVVGELKNNADLCIGSRCPDVRHKETASLGAANQEAEPGNGAADFVVPDIYPRGGELCVGSAC
jgi:hypothetical protein